MMLRLFKDKYGRKRFPTRADVDAAWNRGHEQGEADEKDTLYTNLNLYMNGRISEEDFIDRLIKQSKAFEPLDS